MFDFKKVAHMIACKTGFHQPDQENNICFRSIKSENIGKAWVEATFSHCRHCNATRVNKTLVLTAQKNSCEVRVPLRAYTL